MVCRVSGNICKGTTSPRSQKKIESSDASNTRQIVDAAPDEEARFDMSALKVSSSDSSGWKEWRARGLTGR